LLVADLPAISGDFQARRFAMAKKNEPDVVTHKSFFGALLPIPGTEVYETTVHKGNASYTGYGWSRREADKNADDKYREGKKDK